MQNIDVATSATVVLAAANRGGASLLLQNQSDTTIKLAFGSNAAALTASLGFNLAAGADKTITGSAASREVSAIHGGVGTKVLHWQLVG